MDEVAIACNGVAALLAALQFLRTHVGAGERRVDPHYAGTGINLTQVETQVDARQSSTQFPSGWLVIVLLITTAVLWAVLILETVPHLQGLADGADPFDLRWRGYNDEAARAYLGALGPVGRAYYLVPELALDTFFPPLYAASRALALWWLTKPGRVVTGTVPAAWRWTLVALPVAELILDWGENAGITTMLWSWPDLSPALVRATSLATQLKFLTVVLTEPALIVLAVMALLRWRKTAFA